MSGSRHSYSKDYSSRRRSRSPNRDNRHWDHKDQRSNSHESKRHDENHRDRHERGYDSRHRSHDRSYYDSRRDEKKQDYSRGEYDNKKDNYRKHDGGHFYEDRKRDEQLKPNINVVLRNLPDRARELDIQNQLLSMGASIDDVSLIKDRDTGESRKFAFVRFTSVGHAVQFVEKYRTFEMDSFFVRVDYSKRTQQEEDKEEWRCTKCGNFNPSSRRVCLECRQSFISSATEKRATETESMEMNDGSRDSSDIPSRMLLLRQLDHLTTEESIYNSVKNLQGIHRAMLIRDKLTKMSCEFAFIEFVDVRYASLGLEYARELLQVDGRKVVVSFANQDSFIPVYGQSEYAISTDIYDGLWSYWDKNLYACEYSLAIAEERRRKEEESKKLKEEQAKQVQEKKENLKNDLDAFLAEMDAFQTSDNDNEGIFSVPKINK